LAEIIGHVDARNRSIVSLSIPGEDDDVLVAIDTGFNRELLINEADTARFRCAMSPVTDPVEFADRTSRRLSIARGMIVWFGRPCEVEFLAAPAGPPRAALPDEPIGLVGTAPLNPHTLTVDFATRRVVISENDKKTPE
jgi:predicted aspartyl protease